MRQTLNVVGVLTLVAALPAAGACAASETLRIDHKTAPCAASGHHPRIDARIEPARDVRTARVVFHAAHSTSWYAVEMHPDGTGGFSGALPRAREEAMRIGYFIVASGPEARGRFPETGAVVTDITPLCGAEGLPTAPTGPQALGLLGAADPDVRGFDVSDIPAVIEGIVEETPDSEAGQRFQLAVAPLERVRLTTVSPQGKGGWLRGDGRTLEGWFDTVEDGMVVLSVKGAGKVRVRQEDVVRIEVRKPGSSAMAAVGGLAGLGAGFLTSVLVCATADVCHDIGGIWIGTALGAGIGAMAGGAGEWQPVPLLRERHVSLALQPGRRGGAVALRVSF